MNQDLLVLKRLLLIILFFGLAAKGQELPPVINFSPGEYSAGNQNWMISQGPDKKIFIANSLGLLEYTGAHWNLYPVPNGTIVRAVKVVGDLIFTGAYMEAGYWQEDEFGELVYTSLLPLLPNPVKDGEQFWHIENLGETVVLQSFDGIYLYDLPSGQMTMLELAPEKPVTNLYEVGQEIYFLVPEEGLYSIAEGTARLEIPSTLLDGTEVVLVEGNREELDIITRGGNYYTWNGSRIELITQFNEKLPGLSIFSAVAPDANSFVLGSIEDGIFQIDKKGNILQHYNQERGLQNNTVLSLFLDEDQNLWAGLDNGLSVLNLNSPFRLFEDNVGKIGTVYSSFQNEDYLYLGTNQGLYARKNGEEDFEFVEGTNGQVWSLQQVDEFLFCGHNNGTFLINGEQASRISKKMGTWVIKKYGSEEGVYVQGHYNGFSFLRWKDEVFEDLPLIKNFPHSSKHIIVKENKKLWIGNEHKGVFNIQVNDSLNSVTVLKNFTFPGTTGITSSIFEFRDSLYYATTNTIFQYRPAEKVFSEDNGLEKVLNDVNLISGRMIAANNRIWGFAENSIFHVKPSQFNQDLELHKVYIPREMRTIPQGYENISYLNSGKYLLGLVDGYLTFDEQLGRLVLDNDVRIERIVSSTLDEQFLNLNLTENSKVPFEGNNLGFRFSFPEYKKFVVPVFSYRLVGLSERWSSWSTDPVATFNNLSFGTYRFEVRVKVGEEVLSTAFYNFKVARPWYLSNLLIAGYVLLFLALLYLIHQVYKREHNKRLKEKEKALKMKNLEAEQEIIKLQNEHLEKEMAGKNREVAVSTMSLIKKNEFLTNIKRELQGAEASPAVKTVIRKIDKDTSEEDNWKFFKKAFSNADKDFFKKVKAKHPDLTSNDLKLCAYLRLNLSSKEIAPLLNISVKSVEIKRYRLRKKMELSHEINLVDYILTI